MLVKNFIQALTTLFNQFLSYTGLQAPLQAAHLIPQRGRNMWHDCESTPDVGQQL